MKEARRISNEAFDLLLSGSTERARAACEQIYIVDLGLFTFDYFPQTLRPGYGFGGLPKND